MTPAMLTPFVALVTVLAWASALLLVWIARTPPRSKVLSERARVSVLVAGFLTVYSGAILNVDLHFPVLDDPRTRIVVRLAAIGLGLVPFGWLTLWWKR